jgi:hypothetical protein
MTKPMVRIHDADIDTVIDREMTKDELAQYKIDSAKAIEEAKEKAAKEAAKASAIAKLEALGLNLEEAQAIFG